MPARLASYLGLLRPQRMAQWSIGVYAGPTPFDLRPYPGPEAQPALGPRSLGAIRADGVADPFMVRSGQEWLMFFEVENRRSGRGEIGLATSRDAAAWQFQGIVLREPFHLSYPQVFEAAGAWYLLPEAAASGTTRLYQAESFPLSWRLHSVLIDAALVDPTVFRHAGRWWLLALQGFRQQDELVLYHAERLAGPWHPHPGNPIVNKDRRAARPAGRVIEYEGALIRFSQDYTDYYGRCVRAFAIDKLSPEVYVEHELGEMESLGPSGRGWNATGMHHLDAHQIGPNEWIACVDGRRTKLQWPIVNRFMMRIAKCLDGSSSIFRSGLRNRNGRQNPFYCRCRGECRVSCRILRQQISRRENSGYRARGE